LLRLRPRLKKALALSEDLPYDESNPCERDRRERTQSHLYREPCRPPDEAEECEDQSRQKASIRSVSHGQLLYSLKVKTKKARGKRFPEPHRWRSYLDPSGYLHPGNLLVNGENLHIIDFDDAGFGWHTYELAVGLVSYQGSPRFPKIIEAVLEGYREIRLLDAKTAALLPLFLLVRDLVQIGWFDARPEVIRPAGTERFLIERALRSSSEMGL